MNCCIDSIVTSPNADVVKISFWVAGSILELDSTKEQCRLFKKFVRIAKALLDLRNYSTCMQIISGLTDKSIVRLKRLKVRSR